MLKAVAYGWRQEELAKNAKQISDLGRELYERVSKLGCHFAKVGKCLRNAVESYNDAVGSLEHRVLVTARKFKELKAANGQEDIAFLSPLEAIPRAIQAFEVLPSPSDEEADKNWADAMSQQQAEGQPVGPAVSIMHDLPVPRAQPVNSTAQTDTNDDDGTDDTGPQLGGYLGAVNA